ncbi:hypothetical protein [Mucilaginibacter corticis]|uniref:hypothetical protein n=1 Tax=Mucilaginibacter corticis TaxID=2597670 RepID=UPI0016427554|nr:hypothetical protein [Mucilaginibacter corticis]
MTKDNTKPNEHPVIPKSKYCVSPKGTIYFTTGMNMMSVIGFTDGHFVHGSTRMKRAS